MTPLVVRPKTPFRLDFTVWALRRRLENIVDRWDSTTYKRAVVFNGETVEISVSQRGPAEKPLLEVTVSSTGVEFQEEEICTFVERTLGTNVDLSAFYRFGERKPKFESLIRRFCGLKPPRFPTTFEALVNGIACQQLTLSFGIQLLNRLSLKYGTMLDTPQGAVYSFPQPESLAKAKVENLREIGYSRNKALAIIDSSNKVANGELDLEALEKTDNRSALELLDSLRGVGPWTSAYVLLRGLGRTNIFPVDDVGGRRNLQRWLGKPAKLDAQGAKQVLSAWEPYGGLLYFHLLLENLRERGKITSQILL